MEYKDSNRLTREYLFSLISNNIGLLEKHIKKQEYKKELTAVFHDSAELANMLENGISDSSYFDINYSRILKDELIAIISNNSFKTHLSTSIDRIINEKEKDNKKKKISHKSFVISVFKEMANYHDQIIEKNLIIPWSKTDQKITSTNRPTSFLSYAYYDKGITLGLYLYFQIHGGFLYVNWMWSGVNLSSEITKRQLDDVLKQSDQFLFLRTLNSEFDYYEEKQIRQWCSWEIGNFFTKHRNQKYLINFYGKKPKDNDLLSTFKEFKYVVNGIIHD